MQKETPRTGHSGPPAPQGAAAANAPRTWHSGPPPHVGWWLTTGAHNHRWQWWNGENYIYQGSTFAEPGIAWCDHWPEGARVPRVDPANRWIAPMLPALNAGDSGAWLLAGHLSPHPAEPDPTPEEDEAWRAFSTGQRTRTPVFLTPEPWELAGVTTLALMKELFRRFQE